MATSNSGERQRALADFIRSFTATNGYPPTVREMQAGLGISSSSIVTYHLRAMELRGELKRGACRARAITLVEKDNANE
jgi:repressor LexA